MRDLLTLLVIGGPFLWALIAYLAAFFGGGLYGWVNALVSQHNP